MIFMRFTFFMSFFLASDTDQRSAHVLVGPSLGPYDGF
jgi:hypothetical protein